MGAYKAVETVRQDGNWQPDAGEVLVGMIDQYVQDGGINPKDVASSDGTGTLWKFSTDPGFSIILRVYSTEDGKVFFILEAAIARVAAEREAALTKWLTLMNRQFYDPLRLALTDDGAVVTLMRGRADGFTPNYVNQLLRELIPFSQETFRRLQAEFPELKPFYADG